MKATRFLTLAVSFALATVLMAQQPGGMKAKAGTPIFIHSGDLKWDYLNPTGAPGVKIADVWGNHTTGGFGAFLKFPAGFAAPLHTHTNAVKIVVVSGTFLQTPEGKAEQRMGPGSYVFQPGGNYKHTTGCDKASDCVVFVESSGKFDLKPVATK